MHFRLSFSAIRTMFLSLCVPFVPIFFVPVTGGVDLNGIAALGLAGLSLLYVRELVKAPELIVFVVVPWFGLLLISLLSEAVLSTRTSLTPVISQCVFLMAALGLGFGLKEVSSGPNGGNRLMIMGVAMSISFAFFLLVFAPREYLLGLLTNLTDPVAAVWNVRRLFSPQSFVGGKSIEDVTNFQNIVAQHLFAYAMIVATVSIYAVRIGAKKAIGFWWNISASVFFSALGIILLSGQTLAEMLILILFCGLCLAILRLTKRVFLCLCIFVAAIAVAIPYVSTLSVWTVWGARFSGGNFSTGRTDRWRTYIDALQPEALFLGSHSTNQIDPHNALLGALVETGLIGFGCLLVFLLYLITRPLLGISKGAFSLGLSYLMMMSVGYQVAFVLQIGGGWGMPGLSEWFKFSLFVFGVLISPKVIVWKRPERAAAQQIGRVGGNL